MFHYIDICIASAESISIYSMYSCAQFLLLMSGVTARDINTGKQEVSYGLTKEGVKIDYSTRYKYLSRASLIPKNDIKVHFTYLLNISVII